MPTGTERDKGGTTHFAILAVLYVVMFWNTISDYRPGMDSMTYGTLAKNLLATGDWTTLHYHAQAYADFYQHPPLPIWILALAFKVFGTGDWVLKLVPSVVSIICAGGVYLWAKRIRGEWVGFLAVFILFTSTRFVKYSKGFMLDPFLATFAVLAVYFLLRGSDHAEEGKQRKILGVFTVVLGGLFLSGAFLSKGVFAFAPLIAGLLVLGGKAFSKKISGARAFSLGALWIFGTLLPIAAWLRFGDGVNYVTHYWTESVSGRITTHSFSDYFGPLRNLLAVYWPWIPFFFYGAYLTFRKSRACFFSTWDAAALWVALGFFGGFTLIAFFLEQYLTSFYPFAAVIAALGFPVLAAKGRRRFYQIVGGLLFVVSTAMILFPKQFHGNEWKNPIRNVLKESASRCTDPKIHRLAFSRGIGDIWFSLAMGGWYTPWDVWSGPADRTSVESGSQVLLATETEGVDAAWISTGVAVGGFKLYRIAGVSHCEVLASTDEL